MLEIKDVIFEICGYLDTRSLSNMNINKCFVKLLDDQEFWKFRLKSRLHLISTDSNIDYKLITKFIDNNKSLDESYYVADKKISDQLIKLTILNSYPLYLLTEVHVNLRDLKTHSDKPYQEFIEQIILISNTGCYDIIDELMSRVQITSLSDRGLYKVVNNVISKPDKITYNLLPSYFDQIPYRGEKLQINIPVVSKSDLLEDSFSISEGESGEDITSEFQLIKIFNNESRSLTNGQILYQLAKSVSTRLANIGGYDNEITFDGLYYCNGEYFVMDYIYQLIAEAIF